MILKDADVENKSSQKSNFYKYAIAASVVILLGFFVFNLLGKS